MYINFNDYPLYTGAISEFFEGGVLRPEKTCPKTVQPVLDVLRSKHPEALPPTPQIMEAYRGKPPAMVTVYITNKTVATVAQLLLVSERPGGVDSISL